MKVHVLILFFGVTSIVGCSNDRACSINSECFAGEQCIAGSCEVPNPSRNNGSTGTTGGTMGSTSNQTSGRTTGTNGTNGNTNNSTSGTTGESRTFVDVAAGEQFTCALDSNTDLWCWGQNDRGRLSVAIADATVDRPQLVVGITGVTDIAAARNHRCALKGDGTVWCWGINHKIIAGDSTSIVAEPTAMPIGDIVQLEMGGYSACAIESDRRTLSCWGNTDALPAPSFTEDVIDFAVGDDHSCAVLASGSVRCWGSNYYDALATGDPVQGISGATAISAGERHTCAVADGNVYCWGWNDEGQCGTIPVDFQEKFDQPQLVEGVSNAVDVFAGSTYTCALHDEDRLTCWGGLLGYESTVYSNDRDISLPRQLFGLGRGVTAASAGFIHGCAAKGDELWCWGDNSDRQLGESGNAFRYEEPVQVQFPD